MKKVFVTAVLALALSACTGSGSSSNTQKQAKYDELSKCDVAIEAPSHSPTNKKDFAEFLSVQAHNASADQFVTQKRLDILQLVGWNSSVADSIASCGSDRKDKRKQMASGAFERMKGSTINADEKRALIEAYSSWEAFITSQTPLAKQDFDFKNAYYRNL
ncbi:membrane lipoprotein lipid attachment site-containing protein [Citrobacter sp. RHBSTW-01013]|uniref:membrane lipoprotein lipid attachment site-containing protein n=1 Tax=Citrobacter TaxID=544 RepID=UPI0015EA829E|nr:MULTISPECIES: membrane lipoprotein lipid attachment site-containing protein [Citrobacter]QLR23352.1 membrane lipoprotein lipid attachment site-containing protein [Citrobacter sp. RHBSTW-01013]HBV7986025.1 membrane lipoprotein lipid attachment site-containing protein [Citrobacter freundii]